MGTSWCTKCLRNSLTEANQSSQSVQYTCRSTKGYRVSVTFCLPSVWKVWMYILIYFDGCVKHRTFTQVTVVCVPCETRSQCWLILTYVRKLIHVHKYNLRNIPTFCHIRNVMYVLYVCIYNTHIPWPYFSLLTFFFFANLLTQLYYTRLNT